MSENWLACIFAVVLILLFNDLINRLRVLRYEKRLKNEQFSYCREPYPERTRQLSTCAANAFNHWG